jgi:Fic family protein
VKTPVPPPDLAGVIDRAEATGRLGAVFAQYLRDPRQALAEYLPWDKFRYRDPPGDLTPEEWWAVARLARGSMLRPIPLLLDQAGAPFSFALPDELLWGIEDVTRRASGQIALPEPVANEEERDRYIVSSLIEESITSSQLEGASTTAAVARAMIRSGRQPRGRSEVMIFNNYRAMRRVAELRGSDLTPALVREIHEIVTLGTLDNSADAGRLQTEDAERVAVWDEEGRLLHRPPPATALPARLAALVSFANGGDSGPYMPPLLRAMALHFMMGFDHYFADGNGRTARAVFYWSLLHEGFWLAEFIPISRILVKAPAQYARSFLLTEQDGGDLTHFFLYHMDVLRRALDDLSTYLERKAREGRRLGNALRARAVDLNHRQVAVLETALKDPGYAFTARAHGHSHRVTTETARTDLLGLEAVGYLIRSKAGRRHVWTPAPDLKERLAGRP